MCSVETVAALKYTIESVGHAGAKPYLIYAISS